MKFCLIDSPSVSGALPFYAQTDAGGEVRSDAFMAFPGASAAASAAHAGVIAPVGVFRAQRAPPDFTLSAEVRQRIAQRIEERRIERRREP